MRILLICAAFPPFGKGGGPASSELLARGLVDRGHAVRVLTVADDDGIRNVDGLEVKTIRGPNVYWDYWKPRPLAPKLVWHVLENFNPRAFTRMRREMREFSPDVVCTVSIENINVATWLSARFERIPVAHAIHSYFLMCWRGTLFGDGRNCSRRCASCVVLSTGKKALSRFVDGVTGESAAVLETHLQAGYFKNALARVIPGAISELPAAKTVVADSPRLRVGFIGLHSFNKGIETLARAARLMLDEPIEFVIAGDGDRAYTSRLHEAFPKSTTRFLGWTRPDAFFRQIDVNVVPSLWAEPFGRVSVESQSFGVPALVARSGGLPANIAEGQTGFSFEPDDHVALAGHIRKLSSDRPLLQRLGAAARLHTERFCLSRIAEEFEEFLEGTREHALSKRS